MTKYDTEPTPIEDWIERWIIKPDTAALLMGVGAVLLILSYLSYLAFGVIWFGAMTVTWGSICLPLGFAIYGWRGFKRWRYPTYYREAET